MKMIANAFIAESLATALGLLGTWRVGHEANLGAIGIANGERFAAVGSFGCFARRDALLLECGGGAF